MGDLPQPEPFLVISLLCRYRNGDARNVFFRAQALAQSEKLVVTNAQVSSLLTSGQSRGLAKFGDQQRRKCCQTNIDINIELPYWLKSVLYGLLPQSIL
jgi:hypothetical protein